MITKELAVEFFTNLEYLSSLGGMRGLQPYHIEQFSNALVEWSAENFKRLHFEKGDTLVMKRTHHPMTNIRGAVDFDVPIIFVDNLDDIGVKRG